MADQEVHEFTDGNFEQDVIGSDVPVLVDFWAEWCMPCRMLAPVVEELAQEYDGRVKIGKLDTDGNREVSMKYGIQSIPTLILFKGGEEAGRVTGLSSKQDLASKLDELLA
jgi:thioredoxin 1